MSTDTEEVFHLASAQLVREVPDERLVEMIRLTAEAFSILRREAVRRGIWEALSRPQHRRGAAR